MSVRLFVGNLPFNVTEAEVRELFAAVGTASTVHVPTDRETGKPRGFAFVDFDDRTEGEEAIRRLNQSMFKGRALAVNEARARGATPAAGSGTGSHPRPNPGPRPTWTGPSALSEETNPADFGQRRRNFGADASSGGRRKPQWRASKEERPPKGPLPERGGGQLHVGVDPEDYDDDQELDDFALWAREDAKTKGEE